MASMGRNDRPTMRHDVSATRPPISGTPMSSSGTRIDVVRLTDAREAVATAWTGAPSTSVPTTATTKGPPNALPPSSFPSASSISPTVTTTCSPGAVSVTSIGPATSTFRVAATTSPDESSNWPNTSPDPGSGSVAAPAAARSAMA